MSKHGQWSEDCLKTAVAAVKDGSSVRSAAAASGIPRKTLADYVKRGTVTKRSPGPPTTFSARDEDELVARIIRLQRVGFPLSSADVRRAAFQYATGIGVSAKFGKNAKVNETVGKDWFHSFMARHPTLSLRTSETLSYGRGCGLNRVIVSDFYEVLRKAVTEHHIAPQNMYNMDESGVQMTTRKGAVVAARGSKRVPQLATGEKGETVSLIACCSATSVFLPPFLIFKGVRGKPEFGDGLPVGSKFVMTQSGYAQSETFQQFITFFLCHKPPGNCLIIMDGHRSHIDAEAFSIAEQNSIKILLLPAHTSHELQPLDVAVFKPLKQAFYDQSKFWHAQHPGRGLNKLSFSDVFTPAWNKAATRENAVAGFEASGIWPLNPRRIRDSAFDTSAPSERISASSVASQVPAGTELYANMFRLRLI